jgi:hypothetical protein
MAAPERILAAPALWSTVCLRAAACRALLLQMFVKSAVTLMPGQPDPYEHIGALLTNATRLQAGRKLLLQPGRGFLQALAAQLGPGSSSARRQGCSGALRNCCISAEVGWRTVAYHVCGGMCVTKGRQLQRMFRAAVGSAAGKAGCWDHAVQSLQTSVQPTLCGTQSAA